MSFHDKLLSRKGRQRVALRPQLPPSLPQAQSDLVPSGPISPAIIAPSFNDERQPSGEPICAASQARLPADPPFTVKTIAERWQCSEGVVRKLIRAGKIPSFKIGDLIRVAAEEVAKYECR